jgi:methylmalonyl-CoA/ethylmalonyl-CoA epimerase
MLQSSNEGKFPAPFDHARLYHVGVCVKNIAETVEFYESVFGIGPFAYRDVTYDNATFHGTVAGYRGKRAFAQMGPMMLELIELIDGPTIHQEFMDVHGEGLHHLGFEVDDLQASMDEARRRGLEITQSFTRHDGSGFAYYDSDRVGGVIFEVVEKQK